MESYIFLIVAFVVSAGSLYIGFRIGRTAGASGAGRPADSGASSGVGNGTIESAETQRAIAEAIRTNEKTAEVIQKMRDILNNHNGSSSRDDILAAENEAVDIASEH